MPLYRFQTRAMNTDIETVFCCDEQEKHKIQQDARQWFISVEDRFSRFLPDSEISFINRHAGQLCMVSDAMMEVLLLAQEYMDKTDGVFSIFVLDALLQAGYGQSFESLQVREKAESVLNTKFADGAGSRPSNQTLPDQSGSDPAVAFNRLMKSVRLPQHAHIDLGGIVKGWSVHTLAHSFSSKMERGLINAGGDLTVWGGVNDREPWTVGIENPWNEREEAGNVRMRTGAIATSSTRGRRWQNGHEWMHHLIDPRTMKPSESEIVQCTVAGADLIECEIWAKVLCILGLEDGIPLFSRYTADYEALLFTSDQKTHFCGCMESLNKKWNQIDVDHVYKPTQKIDDIRKQSFGKKVESNG